VQPDTANLQALKFGMPPIMVNNTIDQAHSPHFAVGYMFDKIKPRVAMVTHMSYDEELIPEIVAGIRTHYNGFFQFGAPDIVVVNVTKDAIWTRKAAIPEAGNMARPSPRDAVALFDLTPTNLQVSFRIRGTRSPTSRSRVREREIDPKKYYPADSAACRSPTSRRTSRSTSAEVAQKRLAPSRPSSRPSRSACSKSSTSSTVNEEINHGSHCFEDDVRTCQRCGRRWVT
jgi:hypothetical protein